MGFGGATKEHLALQDACFVFLCGVVVMKLLHLNASLLSSLLYYFRLY